MLFPKPDLKAICFGLSALMAIGCATPAWAVCGDGTDIKNASIFARQTRDWDLFTDLHNNTPLKVDSTSSDPVGSDISGLTDATPPFLNGFMAADSRSVLTSFVGVITGLPTSVASNIKQSIQSRQQNNPPLKPNPGLTYSYESGTLSGYKGTTGIDSQGFNSQTIPTTDFITCQQKPIKNPQREF